MYNRAGACVYFGHMSCFNVLLKSHSLMIIQSLSNSNKICLSIGLNYQGSTEMIYYNVSGTSDSSLIPAGQKRLSKQPIQTEAEKSKTSAGEATSSSDQIRLCLDDLMK